MLFDSAPFKKTNEVFKFAHLRFDTPPARVGGVWYLVSINIEIRCTSLNEVEHGLWFW
jgi:hypothetical protein